jgi:hypothetical protein
MTVIGSGAGQGSGMETVRASFKSKSGEIGRDFIQNYEKWASFISKTT